jgi:ABC-type iron transport system FetAB ATPase subunit
MQSLSRQQLGKHSSVYWTVLCNVISSTIRTVFYVGSVQSAYKRNEFRSKLVSCVEAGSNTSTVALQVVGGDEKGSL